MVKDETGCCSNKAGAIWLFSETKSILVSYIFSY